MKQSIALLLILIISTSFYNKKVIPPENRKFEVTITDEEYKLYKMINAYRQSKGLTHIPLSKSLTYVAQQHCNDLVNNKPDLKGNCNPHSWSRTKKWVACCYTSDHKNAACAWSKPKELTNYQGRGYEIACGSSDPIYSDYVMTPKYALASWKKSPGHNALIVNSDIWKNHKWRAIGIGIYKGFAMVWFGKDKDPDGKPNK